MAESNGVVSGPGAAAGSVKGPRDREHRAIWRDRWFLATLAATVAVVALFGVSSRQIISAILDADPVFFAGLSGTLALLVGQLAYNRYHELKIERESTEFAIRTTEDPVLIAAIESRAASIVDRLDAGKEQLAERDFTAAIDRWQDRYLRRYHVYREVAVLRRNIEAAHERAVEYFDAQAEIEEFHTDADLFAIVIDDINRASGNALRIDTALRDGRELDSTADQGLMTMKLNALGGILRDLTEALERRNQVFESFFRNANGDPNVQNAREYFRVMTSDLRKAQRTLTGLLDRDRFNVRVDEFVRLDRLSPDESGWRLRKQQYKKVHDYVRAARRRAHEMQSALEAIEGIRVPALVNVLVSDIEAAEHLLDVNEPELDREAQEDREATGAATHPLSNSVRDPRTNHQDDGQTV